MYNNRVSHGFSDEGRWSGKPSGHFPQ